MRDLLTLVLLVAVVGTGLAQEPEPPEKAEPPGKAEPPPVIADAVAESRAHLVRDPGGHAAKPLVLLFTPDAKTLVSVAEDRTIQVWDVATKERFAVIRPPLGGDGQGGVPNNLVMDARGEQIAFWVQVKNDKDRVLWTHTNGSFEKTTGNNWIEKVDKNEYHFVETKRTPDVVELFDEKRSATVFLYKDRAMHQRNKGTVGPLYNGTWDRRTTFVCSLKTGEGHSLKHSGVLAFSPDGKSLVIGEGQYLRLVEIAPYKLLQTVKMKHNVSGFAFAADGKTLAVVNRDPQVSFLDAGTLKLIRTCTVPGTRHFANVAWADDKTLVCFIWDQVTPKETDYTVVVLDAATGEVKKSYPKQDLLNQLPPKGSYDRVVGAKGITGTTKIFVRTTQSRGNWDDVSYLLDWATDEASKAYAIRSDFGCHATAIAADLSIAAQGVGARNDVIFWDPSTGQALQDGKEVRRLRPTVRGIEGMAGSILWRPDGKGIAWLKIPDGSDKGHAELDLTTLTWRLLKDAEFQQYGRENARNVLGDKFPKTGDGNPSVLGSQNVWVHERGLVREWGPLSLKLAWPDLEVIGGPEPVKRKAYGPVGSTYTFVAGGRIVSHGYDWNRLQVTETNGDSRNIPVSQSYIKSLAVSPKPACRYVLVGSGDQTLTVFNPETGKVLLTVFATGTDWIAWTPEGYYAATPGGERLMGWHVDSAPDQLGTFHPAARFRAKLYRPDVIKLLLQEGSLDKALKVADKARGQVSKPVTIDQVLPPQVTVTIAPKPGTALKDGQLHIDAVATPEGADPITALQLLVDQRPYAGDKGLMTVDKPRPGPVKASWQVELPAGPHEIRVLARTGASLGTSRGMGVLTEANKPNARKAATLYLLAVGINAYPKPLALAGAVNDATELEKTLRKHKAPLFREMEARVLLDRAATKAGMLRGFDWLKERMTPSDVAIVFYAGHGAIENGEFYLLPQGVNPRNLKTTGLSRQEIKQRMQGLPGRVLVLLDACHSAAIGFLFEDLTRELIDEDCGVMVMCAARPNEVGLEKNGHGHFTRSLVEGLSGKALTSPRDQCVYLHHLQQYVMDRVDELSNDTQHPTAVVPPWMRPFGLSKP